MQKRNPGYVSQSSSPFAEILVCMFRPRAPRSERRGDATTPAKKKLQRFFARWGPNWWGVVASQLTTLIALGPSLLPRTWWTTAASISLSQLYGYAVGSGARTTRNGILALVRRARGVVAQPSPSLRMATVERTWQTALISSMAIGTAATLLSSLERQREIAQLVDETPQTLRQQFTGMAVGTVATAGILGLVQLFRISSAGTRRLIGRFAPALAAPLSGTAVMFGLTYYLNRSVLWEQLMRRINASAHRNNLRPLPGRVAPKQAERSGSPASFESFNSLGRHGKSVVADGPRARDIAAFWGEDAMEPVRAYVGLSPSQSIETAAKHAVRDLRRAGGFTRKHLVIMVGTGTGWLNDWAMSALEFLTRGNCAVVSLQYTVLPSAFAFLFDRKSPKQTARALYREVREVLDTMPANERPKLYMSGESLGAFGGVSVFSSASDMARKLDGAIWAGTPQISPMWRELTARRRAGSPEIRPDIDDGSVIRFSNRAEDLGHDHEGMPYASWGEKRFVFLQHPSDPIVWWDPSLIWQQPTWMTEPRGHDVTARMRWWPWVTFWQIAADMPLSIANKGGHAHRYFEEYVGAWSQVLGIDVDADRLAEAIRPLIRPH